MNNFDFLSFYENSTPEEQQKIRERARAKGGKFALLARILEGDENAAKELEQYIKLRIVTPGTDNIPGKN